MLESEPVPLPPLIERTVQALRPQVEAKQLRLAVECPDPLPLVEAEEKSKLLLLPVTGRLAAAAWQLRLRVG